MLSSKPSIKHNEVYLSNVDFLNEKLKIKAQMTESQMPTKPSLSPKPSTPPLNTSLPVKIPTRTSNALTSLKLKLKTLLLLSSPPFLIVMFSFLFTDNLCKENSTMNFKSKILCPHCEKQLELGFEFFNQNQSVIYFCLNCNKYLTISDSQKLFMNQFDATALDSVLGRDTSS